MSALARSTIRPGLLVNMRTSIKGNMKYRSEPLKDETRKDGAHVTEWKTERTVFNQKEYDLAVKVRTKVRTCITSVCAETAFGLLCPDNKAEELAAAVLEAHRLADEFNKAAKYDTVIRFDLIAGRIANDDTDAFRAISGEVRDLMTAMEEGVKQLDAKAVRDAALKARLIGQMLTPQAQDRVREFIDMARAEARKIVKAGEQAAEQVDKAVLAAMAKRRTSFLDLDNTAEVKAPVAKAARAVDFDPDAKPARVARAAKNAKATIKRERVHIPRALEFAEDVPTIRKPARSNRVRLEV